MATVGEGEGIRMLVPTGVMVDVALETLVCVDITEGVGDIRATQAVSRSMVKSKDMIKR
jgi:hypothetical protein